MSRVLVVAAHPDDEILGLGGCIRKRVNNGDEVTCLILGEGMTSRDDIDQADLERLHNDTMEASKIIGFKTVRFADFPDNKFDSVPLLGIIKVVSALVDEIKPEIVYTHHHGDLNIDHRKTYEAVITACRPVGDYSVKEIYAFETPSSTEWNFTYGQDSFKPNVFVDIEQEMNLKIKAMDCYKTELRAFPHPRSLEALRIIAGKWGTVVGKRYVEAFELVRKVE